MWYDYIKRERGGESVSDPRQLIADNITKLRKSMKLTQAELAEKMNYSDKAISKWERAESIPDVLVLAELANLFSVTVDYFLKEHTGEETAQVSKPIDKRGRIAIVTTSCLAPFIVSLLLCLIFVQIVEDSSWIWKLFIFPLPAVSVILLVFAAVWSGKRAIVFLLSSAVLWTTLLNLFIIFYSFSLSWLIFVIGAPLELILFFWLGLHKRK